jgi:hypothetical protein
MNELMVVYGKDKHGNGNWLYFKTKAKTAKEAYDEYLGAAEKAGINMDNMQYPSKVVLRNAEQNDIDTLAV